MHQHWGMIAKGGGTYLLLCLASYLAGRGLVRVFRLKTTDRAEPALAIVLTYVVWTVVVGLTAGIGVPLKTASPWLWGTFGVLAIAGLVPPWPKLQSAAICFLLCALLPVGVLLHPFEAGLTECPETVFFDGYFYTACGEYAWEHGLNDYRNFEVLGPPHGLSGACMKVALWQHGGSDERDMNIIHRFAATWPGHRCVGMSMLAFLSPWVHAGDTIADGFLLHAWSLFSLAGAVFLFWTARQKSATFASAATAFTVAAGWSAAPFWANQLDNGLGLPYLAVLAAMLELWGPECWSRWLLLGTALAGLWYTYPPAAPFVMVGTALIALPRLWSERREWHWWLGGGAVSLLLAAVLFVPGGLASLPYLSASYLGTWDTSSLLPGIHHLKCYPGVFWGLGGETTANECTRLSNFTGWIFSALALIGTFRLARRGEWGVAACAFFIGGFCFYSLFRLHYSYPFLKLFSSTWWCFAALFVAGADAVISRVRVLHYRSALIAVLILLGCECQFASALWERKPFSPVRYPKATITAMRRVRSVCKDLDNGSVMVLADDGIANLLASYYLRDKRFYLANRQSWLVYPTFLLFDRHFHQERLDDVRYVLGDDSSWDAEIAGHAELVWSGGPYKLWKLRLTADDGPLVLHVVPAIGFQKNGRADSFAVGTAPTVVYVASAESTAANVRLTCFPSAHLTSADTCHLGIAMNSGYRGSFCLRKGDNVLSIPLAAGMNRIELCVLDKPRPDTPRIDFDLNLVYLHAVQMSGPGGRAQLTRK